MKFDLSEVDVSRLFVGLPVTQPMLVQTNHHTYEFDPEPRNNWLYAAFQGFQQLQDLLLKEGKQVQTFATIGTGSGVDAIGAHAIFHPQQLILTDIHPLVIPVARQNTQRYLKQAASQTTVLALHGDLCEPLRQQALRADVIYANLPLIPFTGENLLDHMCTSTFVSPDLFSQVPGQYSKWLLGMVCVFLQDAKSVLPPGGSVVVNLGGRVPLELIQQLFMDCGYTYTELYTTCKQQTQPADVLPGFCQAEQRAGVEFDFYEYEAVQPFINRFSAHLSAKEIKQTLLPYRVSATAALKLYQQGKKIGHVVQVIRGQTTEKLENTRKGLILATF